MIRGNFIYINWEQVNNLVISCGISDADFVKGLPEIPKQIVLIDNELEGNRFNNHSRFQAITGQSFVREFLLSRTSSPKMWLDYHESDDLDLMMPSEIAELLYMAHMKTHLHIPLYAKLQNNYTYLTASEAITKVYYRNLSTFLQVLNVSMKRHLRAIHANRWVVFNRGLTVGDVPENIFHQLTSVFSEGAILAFDEFQETNRQYQIPVLIQQHPERTTWWHDKQDFYRNTKQAATLIYDVLKEKWTLEITDSGPFENDEDDL